MVRNFGVVRGELGRNYALARLALIRAVLGREGLVDSLGPTETSHGRLVCAMVCRINYPQNDFALYDSGKQSGNAFPDCL